MENKTFGDELKFLKKYIDIILLSDVTGNSQVAISPGLQGRVMTSTTKGMSGLSFGWINHQLIASKKIGEHNNAYGGEDRFWIGPEGGQFSIFFKNSEPFDIEHWSTPDPLDTKPFELVSQSKNHAVFKKDIQLENYSHTVFNLRADRDIRILEQDEAANALETTPSKTIKMVAFESTNKMTNTGPTAWEKESGLLSIWVLGMFNPSSGITILIPFNEGLESELGPVVNDTYFGKVPANRLVVVDNVLFFSGDGQHRCKIGLSSQRAKSVLGSYDDVNKVLAIIQYNKPKDVVDYVNSMWKIQDEPYKGDVVNSYNDGPPVPGTKPLGPFYELETSSPAIALKQGQSISHIHRTFHLQGPEADLDRITKAIFGVTINQIKSALPK